MFSVLEVFVVFTAKYFLLALWNSWRNESIMHTHYIHEEAWCHLLLCYHSVSVCIPEVCLHIAVLNPVTSPALPCFLPLLEQLLSASHRDIWVIYYSNSWFLLCTRNQMLTSSWIFKAFSAWLSFLQMKNGYNMYSGSLSSSYTHLDCLVSKLSLSWALYLFAITTLNVATAHAKSLQ